MKTNEAGKKKRGGIKMVIGIIALVIAMLVLT